jgi:hypothetical protein
MSEATTSMLAGECAGCKEAILAGRTRFWRANGDGPYCRGCEEVHRNVTINTRLAALEQRVKELESGLANVRDKGGFATMFGGHRPIVLDERIPDGSGALK